MKIIPAMDMVFQKIFSKPGNEEITKAFLSCILNKKISKIDLDCNKRQLNGKVDEKVGRLNLRAKMKSGEDINLELQIGPYSYMEKRMMFYWSKIYSGKLKTGNDYEKMTPTTSILISNFGLENINIIKKYHSIWNIREEEYHNIKLTNDFEIHILEIPKMLKLNPDLKKDKLALWLTFLIKPYDEEVQDLFMKDKDIKKAFEELEKLKGDPEYEREIFLREKYINDQISFMADYERKGKKEGIEEGLKKGIKEGKKEGKKEGIKEGKKEGIEEATNIMCKKLIIKGMKISDISEITNLSEKEIRKVATTI